MGGLDLFSVQQDILEYVQTSIPQFVVESGGIPTAQSIPLVTGAIEPFIILRFTDDMPTSGGASWVGPTHDEAYAFVDAQCLGPTDTDARELANLAKSYLLGKKFPNATALRKNFGGGQYALYAEANRNPVAFVSVASFRYGTNVEDVGAGSNV